MPKKCFVCGKELPSSLDEYGDSLLHPLCLDCWRDEQDQKLKEAEKTKESKNEPALL